MATVLQNLSTTPVDRVGLSFNASVLVLLEPSSESSLGLSDVDLSRRAWYLLYDVRLLLDGERVFDLLVMKEVLCIQSTPADSRFNRDNGYMSQN